MRVTVDGPAGAPLELRPYQVERRPGESVSGMGAPAGEPFLCLRALPPGRHRITVAADGFAPQELAVGVREGAIVPVEVWLQPK